MKEVELYGGPFDGDIITVPELRPEIFRILPINARPAPLEEAQTFEPTPTARYVRWRQTYRYVYAGEK